MENKLELDTELAYYEKIKETLLQQHEGKFALVSGTTLVGLYDSLESAYAEGLRQFGNVPFLIKQVQRNDPIQFIPCLSVGV